MEDYEYVATLGEGAYGFVWKCVERATGRHVAIKGFKQAHEEPEIMRLAVREARVLQTLKHPAIIQLVEAFKSKSGRVYMVFPYGGLSAYQELENHPEGFPDPQLKLMVWQLLQALVYLHRRKVVHRDIKPGNILVSEDAELKLCDFGFARTTHCGPRDVEHLTSYVVTRWYRAPEVLVGDEYGPSSDIWSLGCTVAELASGLPLFPGKSTGEQLWRIMRCFGPLPESQMTHLSNCRRLTRVRVPVRGRSIRERLRYCDPNLLRLVESCLQLDPRHRPTAAELLHSPYLSGVPRMMVGTPLEQVYSGLLQQQQQQQHGKSQQQRLTHNCRSGSMPGILSAVPTNTSLWSEPQPELQGVAPQQPKQITFYSSRGKASRGTAREYQQSKPAGDSTTYRNNVAELDEEKAKQDSDVQNSNSSMAPMSPENIAGKRHPYLPTDLEDGGQQQKVALSQLHDPGAKGCNPHTPGVVDNRTPENHVAAAINDVGSVEGGTASRLKDPRSGGLSLPVLLQQKGERCDADKASASAAGAAISIAPFRLSGPGPMQQQQHLNNTSVDTIVAAAHASATSTPKLQTPRPSAPLSPCQGSWRSICSIDVATAAAAAAPGARTTDTSESTSTHVKVSSRPVLPFKASDSLPGAVSAAWSILGDEHSTRSPISTGGLLPAEQRSLASGPYQQRPPPHRVQSTLNDESRLFKRMDSSFQLSTLTTMNPSGLLLTTMMDSSTLALCDTAVFECCPHAPSDEATRVHAGPPAPNPCIISATDNIANSTVDLLGYQLSCKATPALSLGTCSDETILSSAKGQRDAEGQEQYDSMLDSLISTTLRHMPCSPTSPTSHCTSVEQPAPNMETRASIEFSAPVGATALSSNRCAKLATENIAATAASSDMLADRGFLVVPTTMISEGRDNPLAAVNPDAVVARIQPIRSLDRQQRSGIQGSSSPVAHHRHLTTKQGGTRQSGRQNYNTRLMMSADLHTEVVPKRLQQPAGRYLLRSQTAITHSAETSRPVEPGNSSGHIPYAWEEPVSALSSAANGRQEPAVISESRAADFIRQQKVPQRNLATAADPTDCFLSNEGAVSSRSRSRMLSNGRIAPTNNALIGAATAMPILPTANPAGSRSRLSIMMSSVSLSRVGLETSVDATPGSPIQTIKITRDAGTCEEVATAAARLLPPLANPPCRSARTTRMQQLPEQQAPPEVALKYAVSGMLDRDVHSENGKELGSHVSTRLRQNGKPQLAARYSIGSMATAGLVDGADVTKKNTLLRKWFKTVKGVFSTTKK